MALVQIGPNFWNIRGHFKIFGGFADIGAHMSIIGLQNGRFLIVDTIPLEDETKKEIDRLTDNGSKIEAVVATHPFHTLAFPAFFKHYPQATYYGTPRHLRVLPEIPWAGDLNVCGTRDQWAPQVQMRIPNGAEFVAPVPEGNNHFSSILLFHPESRSIHVDDTIFYPEHPGFLLKMGGFKTGQMMFHPALKGPGLYHTPEAPYQFRDFIQGILNDWDFDNIIAAHTGNKIGGAKEQLKQLLINSEKVFDKISERNKKGNPQKEASYVHNISGNECG